MSVCVCPIAGWCERHKVTKTEHWHKLCQTRDDYFQAWEEGRGPGQDRPTKERSDRQTRIALKVESTKRLISWIKLFSDISDKGVGDTAVKLLAQKKKSHIWVKDDAREAIRCLLKQYSCSRIDAITRLNQQYPY